MAEEVAATASEAGERTAAEAQARREYRIAIFAAKTEATPQTTAHGQRRLGC